MTIAPAAAKRDASWRDDGGTGGEQGQLDPAEVRGGGVLDDHLPLPARAATRPADRAEAKERISSTGKRPLGEQGSHHATDLASGANDTDAHAAARYRWPTGVGPGFPAGSPPSAALGQWTRRTA